MELTMDQVFVLIGRQSFNFECLNIRLQALQAERDNLAGQIATLQLKVEEQQRELEALRDEDKSPVRDLNDCRATSAIGGGSSDRN